MKKSIISGFMIAIFMVINTYALNLDELMRGNTTLAAKIRNYERQGYSVVLDERTYYNQYRYFMEPVAPYTDGDGVVTMMRKHGDYSLQVDYLEIHFRAEVKVNGRAATVITDIITSTVY